MRLDRAVLALFIVPLLFLLASCGDRVSGKVMVWYVDVYAEPGGAARVEVLVGRTAASRISRVTATAPSLGLEETLLYSSKQVPRWRRIKVEQSLFSRAPLQDIQVLEIKVPKGAKVRGRVPVTLSVSYYYARSIPGGSFKVEKGSATVTPTLVVAAPGEAGVRKYRDLTKLLGLQLVLTVLALLLRLWAVKSRGNDELKAADWFLLLLWTGGTFYLAFWPLSGMLGIPRMWMRLAVAAGLPIVSFTMVSLAFRLMRRGGKKQPGRSEEAGE